MAQTGHETARVRPRSGGAAPRALPAWGLALLVWVAAAGGVAGCASEPAGTRTGPAAGAAGAAAARDEPVTLVFPGSAVGAEAEVLGRQIARFEAAHPGIDVVQRVTPDSADERHQLYVQWLGAGAAEPDVLQLDVIWIPELAAAGWLLPLDRFEPETRDVFPGVIAADRWRDRLYAVPWFVDVGMLYWRTDLMDAPPRSFDALARTGRRLQAEGAVAHGLVVQAARYEGLVTTYLEILGGFGGRLLDPDGRPALDTPEALAALRWLDDAIGPDGLVPEAALTWREEPVRFAFQNGTSAFMRNWPYAYALMNDPADSAVAGRFSVAPMPSAPGGRPTAALGGSHLAVNARSRHPGAAWALVRFLTRPEQMLERARITGQLPPRPSLYDDPRLADALGLPVDAARAAVAAATPRPVTPVYTAFSEILQVRLHRALTGQQTPEAALVDANAALTALLADADRPPRVSAAARWGGVAFLALLGLGVGGAALRGWRRRGRPGADEAAAWAFVGPALAVIAAVAVFPLAWTVWESLHLHDLRMPWRGRPFIGLAGYAEALASARFWASLAHTFLFAGASIALELVLGLALALLLDRGFRGRGVTRALVLVPWALPTVVAALLWRFLFDAEAGVANAVGMATGLFDRPVAWLGDAVLAWIPVILADVWKTTPFVALLLLAGLQGIDPGLYEAARVDGAGAWARLRHVTLPLLKPALLVALLFRSLDALRVFGLVWVLTGGGPGTATEPVALYTWSALLQHLRFGYGSVLSVLVFAVTFLVALVWVRLLGREVMEEGP